MPFVNMKQWTLTTCMFIVKTVRSELFKQYFWEWGAIPFCNINFIWVQTIWESGSVKSNKFVTEQLTVHTIKSGTRDKSGPRCSTHCHAIMLQNVQTVFGKITNKLNFVQMKVEVFVQYLVHCSIRNAKCYYMTSSSKLLH